MAAASSPTSRRGGAGRSGQQPVVVNEVVTITQNNPFLPAEARNLLTFANGAAQVRVNRSLGELGVLVAETERNTYQGQIGLRGPITSSIGWDGYFQYGRVEEETTVTGDAIRNTAAGASRFAAIANTVDIFGPGADLTGFGQPFNLDIREREQLIANLTVSGDTGDVFELPAGPVGFAFGYEWRKEEGSIVSDAAIAQGLSFRLGTETPLGAEFNSDEVYGELLIPVLRDLPFIDEFNVEAAYRYSDYSNVESFDTWKVGANWAATKDVRVRGSRQTVSRAPNIGEFAGATASIPFNSLVNVARLRPRYAGDPCALGTGDRAQCDRFGAPAAGSYDSFNPANLRGGYFFGGNPDIQPETGTTWTVGTVFTPRWVESLSLTVDFYTIELEDAVGQIQPVDALTSCFITNPVADNPLCDAVSRDPATGFILDGFPIDRNIGTIRQRGFDVALSYEHGLPFGLPGEGVRWAYVANIVTDYTIQRNEVLQPIDCRGAFGFTCSSDAVSLVAADYQHRATVAYDHQWATLQFGWTRIGSVRDSTFGSTEEIEAFDYFDVSLSLEPHDAVSVVLGADNLFDKRPPVVTNAGAFNTFPDTYDVVGRTFGLSVIFRQ